MRLPMTKQEWQEREPLEHAALHVRPNSPHLLARCKTEVALIQDNANWLLAHLYEPDAELGACFRGRYLARVGVPNAPALAKEAINWGDLGASVKVVGDGFVVTLEEAKASQCPALCEYISFWLRSWGWSNVAVETAW